MVDVLQTVLLMGVAGASMAAGHAGAAGILSSIVGGGASLVVISVSSFSN